VRESGVVAGREENADSDQDDVVKDLRCVWVDRPGEVQCVIPIEAVVESMEGAEACHDAFDSLDSSDSVDIDVAVAMCTGAHYFDANGNMKPCVFDDNAGCITEEEYDHQHNTVEGLYHNFCMTMDVGDECNSHDECVSVGVMDENNELDSSDCRGLQLVEHMMHCSAIDNEVECNGEPEETPEPEETSESEETSEPEEISDPEVTADPETLAPRETPEPVEPTVKPDATVKPSEATNAPVTEAPEPIEESAAPYVHAFAITTATVALVAALM